MLCAFSRAAWSVICAFASDAGIESKTIPKIVENRFGMLIGSPSFGLFRFASQPS
jgi:hypothetical protein